MSATPAPTAPTPTKLSLLLRAARALPGPTFTFGDLVAACWAAYPAAFALAGHPGLPDAHRVRGTLDGPHGALAKGLLVRVGPARYAPGDGSPPLLLRALASDALTLPVEQVTWRMCLGLWGVRGKRQPAAAAARFAARLRALGDDDPRVRRVLNTHARLCERFRRLLAESDDRAAG